MDSISKWLVGSSMTKMLGRCIINLPNNIRPFSPPDSTLTFFLDVILAKQQTPQHTANRLLIVFLLLPLAHPVKHRQIDVKITGVILCVVTNLTVFRPFYGPSIRFILPSRVFSKVDLPIPFGPRIATFSPTSRRRVRF